MKKSLILLFLLSLTLSGCKIPFTSKEIYIPFLEKSPETVINLAKAKLMGLDNYRYQSTLKLTLQSDLSEAAKEKVLAVGDFVTQNNERVLGIKVANASSTGLETAVPSPESGLATSPDSSGMNLENLVKAKKISLTMELGRQGKVNKTDNESVDSLKFDLGNQAFSFDVENKNIGGQKYFKIAKVPALLSGFIGEYLDKWLLLDQENWDKIESKYKDNFGQTAEAPDFSKTERDKVASVADRLAARIRDGNLFVLDQKLDDETVSGQKDYHYSFTMNKEALAALATEIADNASAESASTSQMLMADKMKTTVKNLINAFGDMKIEAWINKDNYSLQKIQFKGRLDIAAVFKQEGADLGLSLGKSFVDYEYQSEFFVLNQTAPLVKPDQALSLSEVIESKIYVPLNMARIKSRDAKRVADIKQVMTALEMYYNEAGRYPSVLDLGVPVGSSEEEKLFSKFMIPLPENPKPNDGPCPIDFEYGYKALSDGHDYELYYCLGERTGSINSGISIASSGGMFKAPVAQEMRGDAADLSASNETDSDGDGLSDSKEANSYYTDPKNPDSDGDGYSDGAEVKSGYNPNGPGRL